ncbi:hypothetical protein WICMUC_005257 [Wickerhamomyces mucosus]|uniref:Dihydroorotate dehydrogenase (quinone), mitochondrial n=1 Tax=Wickerhamomyces mucosus TaxID=1378264 RepID=A0A9P8PAM7_9ASCO|nr:hypothetical protein WICMUC_005257 [Wickerhamomyces mucosus]
MNNLTRPVLQTVRAQSLRRLNHTSTTPLKAGFVPGKAKLVLGLLGVSAFTLYCFDARSSIHEHVLCPIIRAVTDAEDGHKLGIWLMKYGLTPRLFNDIDDEALKVKVFDKVLSNPIGVAAGLDKNGEAIEALYDSGFGYVEIGSITPKPQPGNPQPRFFRLPEDDAVINRYGFNSDGHQSVVTRLKQRLCGFLRYNSFPGNHSLREGKLLAINLGKNKTGDEVEDYLKGVECFNEYSDVLVINVSSPNTPGLRNLQGEAKLTNLLTSIVAKRDALIKEQGKKTPILVKIAPDLNESEIQSIVNSAKNSRINGIIVSNTTIQRPESLKSSSDLTSETGGLSGAPVKPFALKALRTAAKFAQGSDLVLVGCGGISNGKDALEFGRAGATFVQLYTSFAYKGPGLVYNIKKELTEELKKEGKTWEEIIGSDLK